MELNKYIITFGSNHLECYDVSPITVMVVVEAGNEWDARRLVSKQLDIGNRFAFSYKYEGNAARFKEQWGMVEYTIEDILAKEFDVPVATA